MVLYFLRGGFILLAVSVMLLYLLGYQQAQQLDFPTMVLMMGATVGIAGAVVAIDIFTRRKKLSAVGGVFLGLIAGLIAAYALSFVVELVGELFRPGDPAFQTLLQGVKVFIGIVTCYIGMSLVIQTKDDFRFVIPYVEFAKQVRGQRPTLLDTSVIIDGRILDIVGTRVMQGSLIVPKFVLNELQTVADSADKLRRARGRRGLDILQKLQADGLADVTIEEAEAEGGNVDQKLVALAQDRNARLMTNDFNLAKIAVLRNVEVINLNDLAKALRPVVLPGEMMTVKIIKPGEGPQQGVGYLDDGTMVVVEGARSQVGREVDLTVTSTLQTSAGRMIFGRSGGNDEEAGNGAAPNTSNSHHSHNSTTTPRSASSGNPRNPRRT